MSKLELPRMGIECVYINKDIWAAKHAEIERLRAILMRLCSDDIAPDIMTSPASVKLLEDARAAIS